MQWLNFLVVAGVSVVTIVAGLAYFQRFQVTRPPVGVFNFADILVLMVAIVVIPYVYLALPLWAIMCFIGPAFLGVLAFTFAGVWPQRRTRLLAVTLIVADFVTALAFGVHDPIYLAINNVVVSVVVVGIANLWVQSGMRCAHLAVFASALALYDFIATSQVTLMSDLVSKFDRIALGPFVGWNSVGAALAIGLGDLLLATAFPLAACKAYGVVAGRVAVVISALAIVGVLAFVTAGVSGQLVPVMVVLAPLVVAQDLYWRRRKGPERTTAEYLLEQGVVLSN